MKKTIIAAFVAALLSSHALAQTASINGTTSMGLLQNDWVKAGINTNTGTLGSGGGTSPGLLFDPTGAGTFNAAYDYLTPGSPFDGFSLKVDNVNKTNNNTGAIQISKTGGLTLSNSNTTLTWTGASDFAGNNWTVSNAYTLGVGKPYIDITSTIVAGGAASNVYFAKFIDPDSQGMPGDSSSTDNVLGYGAIPSTNVAFSEATVSRYALGLYSTNSNVRAGINGWNTDAASYINADASCGTGVLYCNGDDTIGLTFNWTGVNSGDTLTASYAYIFGPSAFAAAESAVTGGAGGGDTSILTGTLTNVGSATTAASSSSTPTITGTSTTTGTPTHLDVEGDRVVISTSMVAGDYSRREYNSSITTDVTRTTTTLTTVITSWSNSTTTSAAGTPIVGTETWYANLDTTHIDVITGSTAISDAQWVSNGIDDSSKTATITDPVIVETSKKLNVLVSATYTGNELYTITTPTRFTYDRTSTAIYSEDFAAGSSYADTSTTSTDTSVVTADYDVVTHDSIARTAGVDIGLDMRTDQISTVNKLQGMINRNTDFGKTIVYKYYDHSSDEYNGYSNQFGIGHTKDIERGMDLGIGINKIDTKLTGNNSSIQSETIQLGATLSKKDVKGFDLSGTVQHSMTDYNGKTTPFLTVDRTGDERLIPSHIPQSGTYALQDMIGKTSGTDTSISVKAVGPGNIIRPVVGGTYGRRRVDGYNSSIELVQGMPVALPVDSVKQDYSFATVGVVLNYEMLNVTALHHTDGVNQYGVGLSKTEKDLTFNIRADRLETKQGGSTVYTAGLVYRF